MLSFHHPPPCLLDELPFPTLLVLLLQKLCCCPILVLLLLLVVVGHYFLDSTAALAMQTVDSADSCRARPLPNHHPNRFVW
jgi:hypothetical protein